MQETAYWGEKKVFALRLFPVYVRRLLDRMYTVLFHKDCLD